MTKFIVPICALLLATSSAFAEKPTPVTLTKGGETYQYTVTEKKGAQWIKGVVLSTGEHFAFRVYKGFVDGDVDGRAVYFAVSDAVTAPRIASR